MDVKDAAPQPRSVNPEREERLREAESIGSLAKMAEAATTTTATGAGGQQITVRLAREDIAAIASAIAQALHEKVRSPNFQFDALHRLPFSQDTASYVIENMRGALKIPGKENHLKYALGRIGEGLILEFGVFRGKSINMIADMFPDRTIHGFDSFEGLPEDWAGYNVKADFFDQGGKLPKVKPNVTLHKGWFSHSLPGFAAENAGPVAFIHIDCDLYSSTKDVFDALGDRIVPGTVVAFDEYHNFPYWRDHEHKAWMEFCAWRDVKFEYICYNNLQAAVQVTSVGGKS